MSDQLGLKVVFCSAVLALGAFGMRGCSDRHSAEKKLEEMKYKNIEYVGHPWVAFAGSKGDLYADEFKATPPGAEKSDTSKVNVVVTRGWFKGSTIRIK